MTSSAKKRTLYVRTEFKLAPFSFSPEIAGVSANPQLPDIIIGGTQMIDISLETNIGATKHAFKEATCENIIALCKEYLSALNKFRRELYGFQGKDEISLQQEDPALFEKAIDKRREIHLAVTEVVRELNQTNALLGWLTSARGSETIETFNRVRFRGHETWECRSGKVRFAGASEADEFPIQKAVEIAIGLRCGEFIDSFDIANDPERNLQESADSLAN